MHACDKPARLASKADDVAKKNGRCIQGRLLTPARAIAAARGQGDCLGETHHMKERMTTTVSVSSVASFTYPTIAGIAMAPLA